MIYAHKDGVYRDFGDIQWNYLKPGPNGTKDGWNQVTKEQYDIATDPKKKDFIPPEVKLEQPASPEKVSQTVSPAVNEFSDVNSTGASAAPAEVAEAASAEKHQTAQEFVHTQVEGKLSWGDIYKLYEQQFKDTRAGGFKSWQALKSAYEKGTL